MTEQNRYVICIRNEGCDDLTLGRVYRTMDDQTAASERYARIIDESGEDYLYPEAFFIPIALPQAAEQALFASPSSSPLTTP